VAHAGRAVWVYLRPVTWVRLTLGALLIGGCGRASLVPASASPTAGTGGEGGGAAPAGSSSLSGGATGGAGEGAAGIGGDASATGICTVDHPFAWLTGTGSFFQHDPTLVASSDDAESVTLVSGWQIPEPAQFPPTELRHTSFSPWSSWPVDGLGPTYLADLNGGESFVATPDIGGFTLLFRDVGYAQFMPGLVPGSGTIPDATVVFQAPSRAHFIVNRGGTEYLVGYAMAGDPPDQTAISLVKKVVDGYFVPLPVTIGCSSDAGNAGAALAGDHYLVAFSRGSGAEDCAAFGAAEHVMLARVESDSTVIVLSELEAAPGSVAALRVVSSPEGAWIVWSRQSGSGPPPVWIARVDVEGQLVLGPLQTEIPAHAEWLAATDLGGWLALGWAEHEENLGDRVAIEVRDLDGNVVGHGIHALDGPLASPISLLGSPSGTSLLASWSEGSAHVAARVVRFDCDLPGRP